MSAIVTIQNEHIKAEFAPTQGGRMQSLSFFSNGRWQSLLREVEAWSANSWTHGGMPILWPFPGRLWQDGKLGWEITGKRYPMPIHGFAWAQKWSIEERSDTHLVICLAANASTRKYYPFDFALSVTWRLYGSSLHFDLSVQNNSPEIGHMPFAVGLHPYFSSPPPSRLLVNHNCRDVFSVTADGRMGPLTEAVDVWPDATHSSLIAGPVEGNEWSVAWPNYFCKFIWPNDPWRWIVFWHDSTIDALCIEPWQARPNSFAEFKQDLRLVKGASHETTSLIIELSNYQEYP